MGIIKTRKPKAEQSDRTVTFEMNVESYRRRAAHAAATSLNDIEGDSPHDTETPKDEETTTPNSDTET